MEQRVLRPEVVNAPKLTGARQKRLTLALVLCWILVVVIVGWSQT